MAIGEGEHAGEPAERRVDLGRGCGDGERVTDERQGPVQAGDQVVGWARPASAGG